MFVKNATKLCLFCSTFVPESDDSGGQQSGVLLEEWQVRANNLCEMGPQVCDCQVDGIQGEFEQSQYLHQLGVQNEDGEERNPGQGDDRREVSVLWHMERVFAATRYP